MKRPAPGEAILKMTIAHGAGQDPARVAGASPKARRGDGDRADRRDRAPPRQSRRLPRAQSRAAPPPRGGWPRPGRRGEPPEHRNPDSGARSAARPRRRRRGAPSARRRHDDLPSGSRCRLPRCCLSSPCVAEIRISCRPLTSASCSPPHNSFVSAWTRGDRSRPVASGREARPRRSRAGRPRQPAGEGRAWSKTRPSEGAQAASRAAALPRLYGRTTLVRAPVTEMAAGTEPRCATNTGWLFIP